MKNIKLYINNSLVDLPEGFSLPMTYTTEDLTNPTTIKNSFSKSITLPNTKNNAKIFGDFYRLDRMQQSNTFNPSKRAEFQLFNNGDLYETGYVQLNSISGVAEERNYNITLYGGLGDFFYNLKYNEEGKEKKLSDLIFGYDDEDPDRELDMTISANLVNNALNNDWSTEYDDYRDLVTFIPSYNGYYNEFDSSAALVNLNGQTTFPASATSEEQTYTGYNGYALAKLEDSYTEWEMKEMRASKQRPAIKMSKLIETICNETNSGYRVHFDPSFFSEANPYWSKAFMTLPLLTNQEKETEYTTGDAVVTAMDTPWVGNKIKDSTTQLVDNDRLSFTGERYDNKQITTDATGVVNLSDYPLTSKVNASVNFSLKYNPVYFDDASDNVYISSKTIRRIGRNYEQKFYLGSILAQVIAYDMSDNIIAYSDIYNFTNSVTVAQNIVNDNPGGTRTSTYTSNPELWGEDYTNDTPDASYVTVEGHFKKSSVDNNYYFISKNSNDTFVLSLNVPYNEQIKLKLRIKRVTVHWQADGYDKLFFIEPSISGTSYADYTAQGYVEPLVVNKTSLFVDYDPVVTSGTLVTKKMLLAGDLTPADVLLSYSKLFGLYYIKDRFSKDIYIYTRNSFYKNEIVDLSNKIDVSKDMTIEPILFDKKWYVLNLETPETYYSNKYSHTYNQVYGQQRIDTGYNFNSDREEIYENDVFKNTLPAQNSSKFYRDFYKSAGVPVPCFVNDSCSYTLYKEGSTPASLDNVYEQTIDAKLINRSLTTEWNMAVPGADTYPKQCFYNSDNSLVDIDYSLVFYNGVYNSERVIYITDDVPEMTVLNNELCYLWTNSETNAAGTQIAYRRTSLPIYTSIIYSQDRKEITNSFDFGVPQETYTDDDFTYDDNATIYSKYWKAFYNDQYNINTKKCTCYVIMDEVTNDTMRKLYFFANGYWFLNKIDSFSITSDDTTRCEFIKIQDTDNYLNGVVDYSSPFTIYSGTTFPNTAGTYAIECYSPYKWVIKNYSSETLTMSADTGYMSLLFQLSENTGSDRNITIVLTRVDTDEDYTITLTQEGSSGSSIVLSPSSGYNNMPPSGGNNTIYVVCSGNWTLSSQVSWIHLGRLNGYGSQTLVVTIDPNTTGSSRSGSIIGTSGGNSNTLTFTQRG